MNKEKLLDVWKAFTEKNDFMLNQDNAFLDVFIRGLFANEEKFGLKLCPCRLRDGTRERDLDLICPCNFKIQEIWAKEGRCWCGLFVRR